MRFAKIRFLSNTVFVATVVASGLYAEGDRGPYSGFGARLNEAQPVVLENSQPTPHVTVTAYQASSERADRVQVVDEEASVQFRLVGLPADVKQTDYRVSWKFDDAHQGSNKQALGPTETSTVNIRYNTNNPSHRIVELRVASSDGHWSGTTSFPVFGRTDSTLAVAEGNVLLVPMKVKQTIN